MYFALEHCAQLSIVRCSLNNRWQKFNIVVIYVSVWFIVQVHACKCKCEYECVCVRCNIFILNHIATYRTVCVFNSFCFNCSWTAPLFIHYTKMACNYSRVCLNRHFPLHWADADANACVGFTSTCRVLDLATQLSTMNVLLISGVFFQSPTTFATFS